MADSTQNLDILERYLTLHAPAVPDAPPYERSKLFATIRELQSKRRFNLRVWIPTFVSTAALVVAVVIPEIRKNSRVSWEELSPDDRQALYEVLSASPTLGNEWSGD